MLNAILDWKVFFPQKNAEIENFASCCAQK